MKKLFKANFLLLLLVVSLSCIISCKHAIESKKEIQNGQQTICYDDISIVSEKAPVSKFSVQALAYGKLADASFTTCFKEQGYEITVFVLDEVISVNEQNDLYSDGIGVYFSPVTIEREWTENKTIKVFAFPNGVVKTYKATSAFEMTEYVSGVSLVVNRWVQSDKTVGYKSIITIPYEELGCSYANAKRNFSVCVSLNNTISSFFKANSNAFSYTQFGGDVKNQNTYLIASNDNELLLGENPYANNLSPNKNAFDNISTKWDLSGDYSYATANYGDRRVTLNSSRGTAYFNELYFTQANSVNLYCGATFKLNSVNSVFNGDRYPKFGISVVDSRKNGVYFYVDAQTDNSGNVVGKNVGYVIFKGGIFDWKNAQTYNVNFSADSEIDLALSRQATNIFMLVNGEKVFGIGTGELIRNEVIMPAIFSFNSGITVKNYFIRTDSPDLSIDNLYGNTPAFQGQISGDWHTFDRNNATINLDNGTKDYQAFGKSDSLVPVFQKNTGAKKYLGGVMGYGSVVAMNDFIMGNSKFTCQNVVKDGMADAVTVRSQGKAITYDFNVYNQEIINYEFYLGSWDAEVNLKVIDASGTTLIEKNYGTITGATAGKFYFSVTADVTTKLTLQLSVVNTTDPICSVWLLGATARGNEYNGRVEASIAEIDSSSFNLDLNQTKYKSWQLFGKTDSLIPYAYKEGGEKYFGSLSVLNGTATTSFPDFLYNNSSIRYGQNTINGNVCGLRVKTNSDSLIYKINAFAGESNKFTIYFGSYVANQTVTIMDESGKVFNSIDCGNLTTRQVNALTVNLYGEQSATLIVKITIKNSYDVNNQIWFMGSTCENV